MPFLAYYYYYYYHHIGYICGHKELNNLHESRNIQTNFLDLVLSGIGLHQAEAISPNSDIIYISLSVTRLRLLFRGFTGFGWNVQYNNYKKKI